LSYAPATNGPARTARTSNRCRERCQRRSAFCAVNDAPRASA